MGLILTTAAFKNGRDIPARYTCDGEDVSPQMKWEGVPQGTQSLALICDDPDAPGKTWVHWVIYNIPAEMTGLPEAISNQDVLEDGSLHGITDFGRVGYGGPCPPSGVHRYFFKLFALDEKLGLGSGASKTQLLKALEGHVLDRAVCMGTYSRSKRWG